MNLQYDYTTALFNHQNNISETITIGAIPVMAQYHITDVLADFQRENRNFKVHIIEADSSELKEMLRNEQCDFAFIREHDDSDNEFVKIPFTTDHMVAVLPSSHPLSSASSISLEQLKDENFLFLNKGTYMHTLCVNACKSAGVSALISLLPDTGRKISSPWSERKWELLFSRKNLLCIWQALYFYSRCDTMLYNYYQSCLFQEEGTG